MILIDFSAISVAALMTMEGLGQMQLNEKDLRHLVINSLRAVVKNHRAKYGKEVVIACDGRNYWRKESFPQYKAFRKKQREISGLDWDTIHRVFAEIREELRENFPYKVVLVDRAEADDVIAVLARFKATEEPADDSATGGLGLLTNETPVLIVSGDNDFHQLQTHSNIHQYSNTKKEFLRVPDPVAFLREKIIRGEEKAKDGIPNITSPDDIFSTDQRQKAITPKVLAKYLAMSENELLKTTYYGRNREMIDFAFIPKDIQAQILVEYHAAVPKPRGGLLNYMVKHGLTGLVKDIGDF